MAINPMHQFEVYRIGPEINLGTVNLSFTNASLFMIISAITILFLLFLGTKKKLLIPSKTQFITEMSYTFIAKMINDTAGSGAKSFFPFIFTLFMFVLFCNMIGMLPYSFTVTSHIIVTFMLAAIVFIGVTIIGFIKHGIKYLELFVPKGVPKILLPLIIAIEIIPTSPCSPNSRVSAVMLSRILSPTKSTGLPKIISRTAAAAINISPTSAICLNQFFTVSNISIFISSNNVHHDT